MAWLKDPPAGFRGWRTWDATPHAHIELFCCRGHAGGPVALITAGVHGDEYEGPAAVHAPAEGLTPDLVPGTVIPAPLGNPAAFTAGQAPPPPHPPPPRPHTS